MRIRLAKKAGICGLYVILLFAVAATGVSSGDESLIKIGILAKRGPVRCMQKWSPTAEYLSEKIPGKRFVVVPLAYDKVMPAVEKMDVDFILSNPLLYVEIEYLYGAVRIATLKNRHPYGISTKYGGVIFCRADRTDIRSLKNLKRKTKDLKGKTFMAAAENSFGGWIAPLREMKKNGINPNRDFAGLDFAGAHDEVVYAVRDRDVDAGAIRTDTLERMNAEGKIDLKNYRVLSDHLTEDSGIFLLHSTRAYPEWPMAKLRHTSDNLAEKVAIALIEMPLNSPAAIAARSTGWTIPKNYQSVHECLMDLKIGPYKHLGEITLSDLIRNYWHLILLIILSFLIMSVFTFVIQKLNRKLKVSHVRLQEEVDVTTRMAAELEDARAYTRGLIESSLDALVTFDESGIITDVNEQTVKLTGCTREELIGSQFRNYFTDPERADLGVKKSFEEGKVTDFELVMKSKTGDETEVSYNAIVYSYEKGKARGVFAAARDISESKRVEKELKKAKQAAETATQTKSEFLANMSHEIRTPMNGILGFADILLEDELPQEHRDAIQTIKKSGETLLNLIKDILDLSKVESSKIELETVPFNVEDLILDVGELARTNLGAKQLEINCHTGDIHTNLLGDPTRLRQIITNLTGNAIKFTQEGEIVISVTTEKEDDKQTTLKFSVRDTGIGIPEDKLEIIFESFKQADGSTTREYGGTGLGLTISKKLSQLMDGDMWVESEAGKGSVFYFTAKFRKDLKSSEEIHPVDVSQLEGKPILIVDDNETALKIVADMVTRVGMAPFLAGSGEQALEYFRLQIDDCRSERHQEQSVDVSGIKSSIINHQSKIEIAIIDIMMPGMSGHELAKKISELTGGRTKMIALSSNAAIGSAAETQRSGFAGFVPKPVRRNVLIDLIRTVMGIGEKNLTSIVTQHSVKETISHNVKILYAEDNPVNQKLGLKMLERMGYKAEIASDGAEAVKVVKEKGRFDIIFMDIQMPNMDGMEATKEIRKLETGNWKLETGDPSQQSSIVNRQSSIQRLPIIALTANAMKGDREKYLEAGMDDYLSKPFKKEDIQRMIRKWEHKDKVPGKTPDKNRILIVEDEENMRKSIIRLLHRKMPSSKVMWAEDGIDATVKIGSFMPDLILADIMMPRMDGVELIHYMRKTERYAKIRIIAITGLHKDDSRVSAIQDAGVEQVVYKPWEDEVLIAAIRDSLSS